MSYTSYEEDYENQKVYEKLRQRVLKNREKSSNTSNIDYLTKSQQQELPNESNQSKVKEKG